MIYLASPYTSPNKALQDFRYSETRKFLIHHMRKGAVIFSPIVYGHELAKTEGLPTSYTWWKTFNDHMVKNSTGMYVLQLPKWEESRGVAHEIDLALENNIPIVYKPWAAAIRGGKL